MKNEYKDILRPLHAQAKLAGACERFTGKESIEELARLFKSPQGVEFCIAKHFPNMATLRALKAMDDLTKYGIYVDAGNITIENPERVVLVGRTTAEVNCDRPYPLASVVIMHGAKGIINARGWAVVHTEVEPGSIMIRNISDNAVIV